MIKLDINIGDTILVGRFKNKRIEVKEIGVDEHGGPTVNGRSILKIRIEKLMKTKKNLKEAILNKDWGELIGKTVTLIDDLVVTDFKTNKNIKLTPGDTVKIIDSARVNSDIKIDIAFIEFKGKKYISNPGALLNKSNLNESKQFSLAQTAKKILNEGSSPISTRTKIQIVVDLINNKFGNNYAAQYDETKSFYGNDKMLSIKSPNTKIPIELESFLQKSGYSLKADSPSKRSGYYRIKCYVYKT